MSRIIRTALFLSLAGLLAVLPGLIAENPVTFVVFSFVGQPLLLLSFALYLISVLSDLRKSGLFG